MQTGQMLYLVPEGQGMARVTLFEQEPDVMNVPQVAELLGVNPQTVRREVARGRLACVRVGRSVRVTKAQLIAYLNGGNENE